MKQYNLNSCETGSYIAQTIYDKNDTSRVLVKKGVKLTENLRSQLLQKGIVNVFLDSNYNSNFFEMPVAQKNHASAEEVKDLLLRVVELISQDSQLHQQVIAIDKNEGIARLNRLFGRLISETARSRNLFKLISQLQRAKGGQIFEQGLKTAILAIIIGMKLKLTDTQLFGLLVGSLLHDIGEIESPLEYHREFEFPIDEEFKEIFEQHTIKGYEMIKVYSDISLLSAHCALQHHERFDGLGYPRQLKGDKIHIFARIIAVAETFERLTNPNNQMLRLLPHEALEYLYAHAYSRFDPDVIQAFQDAISIFPIGLDVVLSNGQKGKVTGIQAAMPNRPIVEVDGQELDLSDQKYLNLTIVEAEPLLI